MTTSVALCTYNGEKYLKEQLDSILNQTIVPDEIIICDDISTDSTVEIIKEYQSKFPIIQLFVNEKNLGFIKNFEKAISLCTQDIIIICDQDDVWKKNKVEETIAFFKENPEYDGVFHDLKLMDEQETQPSYLNWKNISYKSIEEDISNQNLFYSLIVKGSFILGCALAIRKVALEKYAIKDFPFAHDYFIVQKLSSLNKLGFIAKSLSSYRLHSNQVYGLRYKSENKEPEILSKNKQYFNDYVWTHLKVLEKYKEIQPEISLKKTVLYKNFILYRNNYLKMLSFIERKIYIAKCIRHHYLDLSIKDLFSI